MLALVGSGEYLPPMELVVRELIRLLQAPVRVVCLPTAAGAEGAERIDYWSRLGVDHFTRLGVQKVDALPVVDRASANDPSLAAVIASANFVYLSGGKPDYLYKTLDGSLTWKAIQSVLENGGLLAGCSAGAMVLGEKFFGLPRWKPGFNFLPGVTIIPHFDEIPEYLLKPIRLVTGQGLILIGVDGNTALVQTEQQFQVLGKGGVTVWEKSGKNRYAHGARPQWG